MRNKPPSHRSGLEISSLNAIEHVLENRPDRIRELLVSRTAGKRAQKVVELAQAKGIAIHTLNRDREGDPVVAHLAPFPYRDWESVKGSFAEGGRQLVLALDHLQDPQNFGALCRSAEGLGATAILVPKDRSVPVSAGVYHASVGAVETIPIVAVTNLGEGLRKLKDLGFWVVAAALGPGATAPWEAPDFEKVALVLGAEQEGISAGVEKLCDWRIRIPLPGRVQSLNVSAAGAVLLYEWARRAQRPESP